VPVGVRQPRLEFQKNACILGQDYALGDLQLRPEDRLGLESFDHLGWLSHLITLHTTS
jgi:hypothetical protein